MIIPVSDRIGILLDSSHRFQIPRYQRDYKWGLDETMELIEDIQSVCGDPENQLFLGTMIFENSNASIKSIVDGQQRITSLILLLIACRERAKDLSESTRAMAIQKKIGSMDDATGQSTGCRLIAAESIRDVFEYISSFDWDGQFPQKIGDKAVKRQVNRLRPIYRYFKTKVVDSLDSTKLTAFLNAIYYSYVFKIEIENDIQAIGLFERTNARGLDLEVSDLLKNYLFSKKLDADLIEDSWSQITANSSGQMLRMLKHFYVCKKGHVTKPVLYKKLKGYGNDIGAENLTKQLLAFSQYYRVARFGSPEDFLSLFLALGVDSIAGHEDRYKAIYKSCEGLREFGISQYLPVAHSAMELMLRCDAHEDKSSPKLLVRLFEAFEKYHFINNAICERVGNEIELLYAKACEEMSLSTNFTQTVNKFIDDLRKRIASEDEFVINFPKKVNYQEGISLVAYVFDRINNFGLQPGAGIRIYEPDARIFRKTHNIEHFLPQKPKSGALDPKDAELVDDVGNLLILPSKTNSRLSNDSPVVKMDKLSGVLAAEVKHLRHVEDFINEYKGKADVWNAESIAVRSSAIARKAYRDIWKF